MTSKRIQSAIELYRNSEESLPVCAPIYYEDKQGLLFRASYYKRRINLEIFHALADGTSALQFLRAMVLTYLEIRYRIPESIADYDADREQKNQDAFYQYYDSAGKTSSSKRYRSYRIRGETLADHQVGVAEGFLSAKKALEKAYEYDATLSEFLIALLICSIYEGMAVREQRRPAVITVLVDLRRYCPLGVKRCRTKSRDGCICKLHHCKTALLCNLA